MLLWQLGLIRQRSSAINPDLDRAAPLPIVIITKTQCFIYVILEIMPRPSEKERTRRETWARYLQSAARYGFGHRITRRFLVEVITLLCDNVP